MHLLKSSVVEDVVENGALLWACLFAARHIDVPRGSTFNVFTDAAYTLEGDLKGSAEERGCTRSAPSRRLTGDNS